MCLVWPDDKPDEHIVEVEIDDYKTVASLKDMIKDKRAHALSGIDACDLILWKCSGLPDDDNLEQTLKTLRFDGSDNRLVRLTSTHQQISKHFKHKNLSNEPIHILVEVPLLGEYGTCICYSTLKGLIPSLQPCQGERT